MGLQVACSGLDVRGSNGAVSGGKDFVAHEEAGQVVVLLELVHDGGKGIALRLVPLGRILLDLRVERVQVQPDVDARVGKGAHALGVVLGRVDVVDADRVGADRLHQSSVEAALCCVDERVVGDQLVRNAWNRQPLPHSVAGACLPLT